MIKVSESFCPPIDNYINHITGAWQNAHFSNFGPLHQKFEESITSFLGVRDGIAVSNGTVALELALKTLPKKGDVIVTSFSWIATHSAIVNSGNNAVYCDIEEDTLSIDPSKIENLITQETVAIVGVHVFGNPVDVIKLEEIGKKHNIKIIYDAAQFKIFVA